MNTYKLDNGQTVNALLKCDSADGNGTFKISAIIDGRQYRDAFTMVVGIQHGRKVVTVTCNKTGNVIDGDTDRKLIGYLLDLAKIPAVKKGGLIQFYFPNYPSHPLNGMYAYGCGAWTGESDGKMERRVIYGLRNQYDMIPVTAEVFGIDKLLVKQWHGGETEYFYLCS